MTLLFGILHHVPLRCMHAPHRNVTTRFPANVCPTTTDAATATVAPAAALCSLRSLAALISVTSRGAG